MTDTDAALTNTGGGGWSSFLSKSELLNLCECKLSYVRGFDLLTHHRRRMRRESHDMKGSGQFQPSHLAISSHPPSLYPKSKDRAIGLFHAASVQSLLPSSACSSRIQ